MSTFNEQEVERMETKLKAETRNLRRISRDLKMIKRLKKEYDLEIKTALMEERFEDEGAALLISAHSALKHLTAVAVLKILGVH